MDIIPAIDLLQGNCVRLIQGDYGKVTQFNTNPIAQAISWEKQGATRLHLVDLDGAKTGDPVNDKIIREIRQSIQIPIQLGGGIRSIKRAETLLSLGLDKVILGTAAIERPEIVKELVKLYPGKVLIGIDSKDGLVATNGWLTKSNVLATDLARSLSIEGLAGIIATDIATDGMLTGPNIKAMKEIATASTVPIIASGGVGSMSDLLELMSIEIYGIKAVIVGRALYDGSIDLKEAMKAVISERIQDPSSPNSFIA